MVHQLPFTFDLSPIFFLLILLLYVFLMHSVLRQFYYFPISLLFFFYLGFVFLVVYFVYFPLLFAVWSFAVLTSSSLEVIPSLWSNKSMSLHNLRSSGCIHAFVQASDFQVISLEDLQAFGWCMLIFTLHLSCVTLARMGECCNLQICRCWVYVERVWSSWKYFLDTTWADSLSLKSLVDLWTFFRVCVRVCVYACFYLLISNVPAAVSYPPLPPQCAQCYLLYDERGVSHHISQWWPMYICHQYRECLIELIWLIFLPHF